jgi:hypothetical protein
MQSQPLFWDSEKRFIYSTCTDIKMVQVSHYFYGDLTERKTLAFHQLKFLTSNKLWDYPAFRVREADNAVAGYINFLSPTTVSIV